MIQQILKQLDQLQQMPTADQLKMIFDVLGESGNRWDPAIREYLKAKLKSAEPMERMRATVVAAALYAVVPSGLYVPESNEKIDPFFHSLRKALISCDHLRNRLRENSVVYDFYPEFNQESIRSRVAAVAKAHAKLDLGADELIVLFSLGGYFSFAETDSKFRSAVGAKGTTCVMTARGVYHASGIPMFNFDRPPDVSTPKGPQFELGIPTMRPNKAGQMRAENSLRRADQDVFGPRGFNNDDENETNRPPLQTGDIYFIDGDGDHKYLFRAGLAFGAHVGIVVQRSGNKVDTIDGGRGNGAKIELTEGRDIYFATGAGWTLQGTDKTFTSENVAGATEFLATIPTAQSAMAYMKTDPNNALYKGHIKMYDIKIKERDSFPPNDPKRKIIDDYLAKQKDAYHRSIRESMKGVKGYGKVRTLAGWWKPEQYSRMSFAGYDVILKLVNELPPTVPNARYMTIEAMR